MTTVTSDPNTPGDLGSFPYYRGDPFARAFQFVGQDTTDWEFVAQLRVLPDYNVILATFDVETNYQGNPELVNVTLAPEQGRLLPPGTVYFDVERQASEGVTPRTMLKGTLEVDPDVTRTEG